MLINHYLILLLKNKILKSPPWILFALTVSNHNIIFSRHNLFQVYTESNHWDCIATCFFIDCANNVVQFIETIYKILKPGGVWINLGPLLYHFSDLPNEDSIEPSYDAIRDVILGFGFQLEVINFSFTYTVFPKRSRTYSLSFFFRRKRQKWKRVMPRILIVCYSANIIVCTLFVENPTDM